jgi:hypothetical protein
MADTFLRVWELKLGDDNAKPEATEMLVNTRAIAHIKACEDGTMISFSEYEAGDWIVVRDSFEDIREALIHRSMVLDV